MADERVLWPDKYNEDKPTVGIDWSTMLAQAATITSATFTPIDGSDVTIDQESFTDTTSQCRLNGGSPGVHWVLCGIVTNAGEPMYDVAVFTVMRQAPDALT